MREREREMEKEANQDQNPSLLSNNLESPRSKPLIVSDRLKRDEWSEGAVSCLLEAYEAKWVLRNRAKLKGHDWEDVARHVSSRASCSKSPKTQTQCKNKIESMKKRYRSESATADGSSWPLYPRLDLLLRGSGPPPPTAAAVIAAVAPPPPLPQQPPLPPPLAHHSNHALMLLEPSVPVSPPPQPPPPPPHLATAQNSYGSDGGDRDAKVRPFILLLLTHFVFFFLDFFLNFSIQLVHQAKKKINS